MIHEYDSSPHPLGMMRKCSTDNYLSGMTIQTIDYYCALEASSQYCDTAWIGTIWGIWGPSRRQRDFRSPLWRALVAFISIAREYLPDFFLVNLKSYDEPVDESGLYPTW